VLLLTPMFVPLAAAVGMDTVQLGIMMIVNLSIGLYHPPIGTTLFITSSIAKVRIGDVVKELIPFYFVAIGLLLGFRLPALADDPLTSLLLTDKDPSMSDLSLLAARAYRIRRYALRMGEVQGQGYIGQALGWADVLAVAYGHAMKLKPDEPQWEGRDRFLLSHGHYAIAHYAALIEAGIVPESELETYGSDDSRLPMSGMASYTPGMEISGGSLGQGLAIGVGMALGLKQKKNPAFVYNSMSDGELDEGSTWEAAMGAAHHRLDNLICLVDINNQQADGPSGKVLGFEPLADKWAAFGWHVQRVDGNDQFAVLDAFDRARHLKEAKPRVILFDTLMGKGVPFLESREKNHFIRVDPPEWQQALAVLDQSQPYMQPEGAPA
jgi:transketolase